MINQGDGQDLKGSADRLLIWVGSAFAFVVVSWAGWWGMAWLNSQDTASDQMIEKFGQIGDNFGSLNALFTGLALVGLAYASFKQKEEIELQKDQMKKQEIASKTEAEDRKKDRVREDRYQYLAARLNAATALFNTCDATDKDLADEVGEASKRPHANDHLIQHHREIKSRKVELERNIAVLLHEAHLGFDDGEWTPKTEERAIKRYLGNFLRNVFKKSVINNDLPRDYMQNYIREILGELISVEQQFGFDHPEIARKTQSARKMIDKEFEFRINSIATDPSRVGNTYTTDDKSRIELLMVELIEQLEDKRAEDLRKQQEDSAYRMSPEFASKLMKYNEAKYAKQMKLLIPWLPEQAQPERPGSEDGGEKGDVAL